MRKALGLATALVLLASFLLGCAQPQQTVVRETVPQTVVVPATAEPGTGQPAGGPGALEVYDPTGAIEVTELFSARLDSLEGKTICEVSDQMWEADRTFELIRQLLQQQYPTAKIIPWTEFPEAAGSGADVADMGTKLKEAGCQAAIVGNAG